jgi:hypothetical protein
MSGRCRSHLYSRAMQAGARGACVRCGAEEPLRGIISDPEPYRSRKRFGRPSASRSPRSRRRPQVVGPVEDAFDAPVLRFMTKDELFRKLDSMLGRPIADVMPPAPVSDYTPTMAREFYDDAA